MPDEFLLKLGHKIRFERMKKSLSQEELGAMSNLSTNAIGTLERGLTNVRIKTLEQIAKALDLELKDLFDFKL